jgi:hypothetical protein
LSGVCYAGVYLYELGRLTRRLCHFLAASLALHGGFHLASLLK